MNIVNLIWSKPTAVALLFCVCTLIGVYYHEPWFDEIQAWNIVINSNSLYHLYSNCLYEGHPLVWHILLYLISRFSSDIIFMQLLSVLIGSVTVFVFVRYSPFSFIQSVLFCFGYLMVYQYTIIARCYGLISLFSFLFLFWFTKDRQSFWGWLLLVLLANVSATGVIMSLAFLTMTIVSVVDTGTIKDNIRRIIQQKGSFTIFSILGILLSLWQIYPEVDNTIGVHFYFSRLIRASGTIFQSYFWIQSWAHFNEWNGVDWESTSIITLLLSFVIFCIGCWIFFDNYLALVFYITGTAGILLLSYMTMKVSARFLGHYYIILIIAFWIQRSEDIKMQVFSSRKKYGGTRLVLQSIMLYSVLVCQFVTSVGAYTTDLRRPFSNSQKVADFILESKLQHLPITGDADVSISPLSLYLNKELYYAEKKGFGHFILWNKERQKGLLQEDIFKACYLLTETSDSIIVIFSSKMFNDYPSQMILGEEGGGDSSVINLDAIARFDGALVSGENYFVYVAKRKIKKK